MHKLGAFAVGLLSILSVGAGFAQDYPNRPITLVNPYAAGGPADVLARTIANGMKDTLGQTVVVENKTGGGTVIGAAHVARSRPDGYTLFIGGSPSHVIAPALVKDAQYDGIADFTFIATVGSVPNVLVVPSSKPWKSVPELVAAAKAGDLSAAHVGIGSIPQFLELLLQQRAGIKLTEVGYRGAAPAVVDLTTGAVDLGFINIPPVLAHVSNGTLRALAVAHNIRSAQLPDVPTMAEVGYPNFEMSTWYGISAPAKTPKPIVDKLYNAVRAALDQPDIKRHLASQGVEPFRTNPDEYLAYVKADAARMMPLIKASGMKPQ